MVNNGRSGTEITDRYSGLTNLYLGEQTGSILDSGPVIDFVLVEKYRVTVVNRPKKDNGDDR